MSVINKMLKDLEQRQEPEGTNSFTSSQTEFQPSSSKKQNLILILLVLVIVLLAALVVWLFVGKADEARLQPIAAEYQSIEKEKSIAEPKSNGEIAKRKAEGEAIRQTPMAGDNQSSKKQLAETVTSEPKINENKERDLAKALEQHEETSIKTASNAASSVKNDSNKDIRGLAEKQSTPVKIARIEKPTITAPIVPSPEVNLSRKEALNYDAERQPPILKIEKSSTVLTKEQRIDKLMSQAQKSFDQGYITESISQLKEVLAADDGHENARNLLAVAWYGRGENQMAVSILNDGLSRYPRIEKWRLTAAKMFFKENNPAGAFSYLEADLSSASAEYYTMKGTLARQLQRFDKAETAYSMLTQLQPNVGNWWLGYAIALDSQSKSELALQSYKMVVEKGGVSPATLNFAQQRIQELQG